MIFASTRARSAPRERGGMASLIPPPRARASSGEGGPKRSEGQGGGPSLKKDIKHRDFLSPHQSRRSLLPAMERVQGPQGGPTIRLIPQGLVKEAVTGFLRRPERGTLAVGRQPVYKAARRYVPDK